MNVYNWLVGSIPSEEKKESSGYDAGNVSETIVFDAPLDKCLAVITDYEKYPEFVSGSIDAKIREKRDEGTILAYYKSNISFTTVEYTLEHKVNETKDGITWTHTGDGPWAKNVGGWKLKALSDNKTEATYYVTMELQIWTPGFLKDWIIGNQLPAMLQAFKKRIESLHKK
jgi:ribosome-associated toxin RatA of RatAB toxin-antitoxin module